jgi:hypothetical protein
LIGSADYAIHFRGASGRFGTISRNADVTGDGNARRQAAIATGCSTA